MKLIQSTILKNILLTSAFVGVSMSAVVIINDTTDIHNTLGYDPDNYESAVVLNTNDDHHFTRRNSHVSNNSNTLPVVTSDELSNLSVAPTAVCRNTTPVVATNNSITIGNVARSTQTISTNGNNSSVSLLAQSSMFARANGTSTSGGVTISTPFAETRPNVGVQQRGIDYGTGEPFPDEDEPLGDGLIALLAMAGLFAGQRKLRMKNK